MLEAYPDILTVKEICEILSISKNTAYHMMREQMLPAYKIGSGKNWRVNKDELIDYLNY